MKVEYRDLPHAGEKARTVGIAQETCTKSHSRKSKISPSPRSMTIPLCIQYALDLPTLFLMTLQSEGRDVKKRRMMYPGVCVKSELQK